MRTNRRVNIFSLGTTTGMGATRALEMKRSGARVWVTLEQSYFVGLDGVERTTEGRIVAARGLGLTDSDVIQIVDGTLDDRRYRLEEFRERWAASGRLAGHTARLIRDTALES